MKKIITFLMMFFISCHVFALNIESEKGILINLNEDKIINFKNKEEKTSIASLTKIMTSIIAIENITDYDKKITLTKEMVSGHLEHNLYIIWLDEGQILTLKDLLYATFITSASDATKSLVLSVCNSEEEFVKLMNNKVKELGLKQTRFSNSVGLDDLNNYSTVEEVSLILKYALKNKKFKEMFETKEYILSDNSQILNSSLDSYNKRIKLDVSKIVGSKTGFTDKAGLSLASVYYDDINQIKYMLVTVGGGVDKFNPLHLKDAVNVYNYYQNNYKYHSVFKTGDLLLEIEVKKKNNLKYYSKEDISYFADLKFKKDDVVINYEGINQITKSMKKGSKLGDLTVKYQDDVIYQEEIILNKNILYLKYYYYLIPTFILFVFFIKRKKK